MWIKRLKNHSTRDISNNIKNKLEITTSTWHIESCHIIGNEPHFLSEILKNSPSSDQCIIPLFIYLYVKKKRSHYILCPLEGHFLLQCTIHVLQVFLTSPVKYLCPLPLELCKIIRTNVITHAEVLKGNIP